VGILFLFWVCLYSQEYRTRVDPESMASCVAFECVFFVYGYLCVCLHVRLISHKSITNTLQESMASCVAFECAFFFPHTYFFSTRLSRTSRSRTHCMASCVAFESAVCFV